MNRNSIETLEIQAADYETVCQALVRKSISLVNEGRLLESRGIQEQNFTDQANYYSLLRNLGGRGGRIHRGGRSGRGSGRSHRGGRTIYQPPPPHGSLQKQCFICGKVGHLKADCWFRRSEEEKNRKDNV
jgi:hypothetical protein